MELIFSELEFLHFRVRMGEPDTDSKHYKAGWGGLVVNVILVGMGIAMVSVGDSYRGEEYCK